MMPPENPSHHNDDFDVELELRQALRRIEPQRDFSKLSYARLDSRSQSRVQWWSSARGMLALAAAVILVILVPVAVTQYHARQQRQEEARAELIEALRITESKLQKTRQIVVRQLDRRNLI